MPSHALRHRTRAALAVGLAAAAAGGAAAAAPDARAGLSSWTSLPGLDAAAGASWVRDYEVANPVTVLAATEGSGVYRSSDAGLTWAPFNTGLMEIPGARDVRHVLASGATLLAGTSAGLFRSTGGAWQPVAQEPEPDPRRPIRLHRAVQRLFRQGGSLLAGTQGGGVYVSLDDGATWRPPAPGNGMPSGTTVWDLDALIPGVVFAATSDGVYRSADGGTSWAPATDGIAGTVLRVIKDPVNPNVFYAATTSGLYRSINLGVTWASIDGTGSGAIGNETVRALEPLAGGADTRLYAGTADGVWVGSTSHGPLPGPVRWRKVTEAGLAVGASPNDIVWTLQAHLLAAGTLFAGTQSNGGSALTFQPPASITAPAIAGEPRVGVPLTASTGRWSGTPEIAFAHQWQRCSTAQASSCADIDDATDATYVPVAADLAPTAMRLRVVVTAENDVPTFEQVRRASGLTAPTAANPNPTRVPGHNQLSAPSIGADAPADATLPQSGDVLRATLGTFNPAPDARRWRWFACNAQGAACDPVAGATGQTIRLTDEHVGRRFRVAVTGSNEHGAATTPTSGATNVVFPGDPAFDVAPSIVGRPLVGETLLGSVGAWRYAGTTYVRRWLRCDADGSSCATIDGARGAAYVPTADDLGRRLKLEVTADANEGNVFPAPVSVETAPTEPVALPPADAGSPPHQPPPPTGDPRAALDTSRPSVSSLRPAGPRRVPRGAEIAIAYRLSEAGRLRVALQRTVAGRRRGARCVVGGRRGRRCTRVVTVATRTVAAGAGGGVVRFATRRGRRALPVGRYRVAITPIDAAGNRGATKTIAVRIVARKPPRSVPKRSPRRR